MLTGTTDSACPLAAEAVRRARKTAASAWAAAVIRKEFHEIIKA
jgi:hypothetical protein